MAAPMIGTNPTPLEDERSGEEVTRGLPGVVRMLMALNGIQSKEVAEYLHLHPNRMSERMTGKKPFTLAQTIDLARLFGVSVETMLRDPAEVRARVQNWKMTNRAAVSREASRDAGVRHLTPVPSRNPGFSTAAISGPSALPDPPALTLVSLPTD